MLYIGCYGIRRKKHNDGIVLGISSLKLFIFFLKTRPYYHTVEIEFFFKQKLSSTFHCSASSRVLIFKHVTYKMR